MPIAVRQTHHQAARARRLQAHQGKGQDKGIAVEPYQSHRTAIRATISPQINPDPMVIESSAPQLLTLASTAEALSVSIWTVREWVDRGLLKVVRLPGRRLIRVENQEVARLIQSSRA